MPTKGLAVYACLGQEHEIALLGRIAFSLLTQERLAKSGTLSTSNLRDIGPDTLDTVEISVSIR